uniref:Solute carrier family 51 alpha subunit n=1 Tax=Eptatretus burgeri TaxID=7764 RepID=A0A8C4QLJ2_EPTBU
GELREGCPVCLLLPISSIYVFCLLIACSSPPLPELRPRFLFPFPPVCDRIGVRHHSFFRLIFSSLYTIITCIHFLPSQPTIISSRFNHPWFLLVVVQEINPSVLHERCFSCLSSRPTCVVLSTIIRNVSSGVELLGHRGFLPSCCDKRDIGQAVDATILLIIFHDDVIVVHCMVLTISVCLFLLTCIFFMRNMSSCSSFLSQPELEDLPLALNLTLVVSMLISLYPLGLTFAQAKLHPRAGKQPAKYALNQLTLVTMKLQTAVFTMLAKNGHVPCLPPFPSVARARRNNYCS